MQAGVLSSGSSSRSKKRKRLSFQPTPIVHEIDFKSPTKHRRENREHRNIYELKSDELKIELGVARQSMGDDFAKGVRARAEIQKVVEGFWCTDLREELEAMGFRAPTSCAR